MKLNKMDPRIHVVKDKEALYALIVKKVLNLSKVCIKARGMFTLVLSGGTTPGGIYALMGSRAFSNQFEWDKIHLFVGDERFVPQDNPRSNFKMISETLLSKINIPPQNIHPIPTDQKTAAVSASLYQKHILDFFNMKSGQIPAFDLNMLGMGEDGHTASLFPGTPALREKKRLIVAVSANGIPEKRISFTFPLINHSRNIFFVIAGASKAQVLKRVLSSERTNPLLPIQKVHAKKGKMTWFLDQSAASELG